MHGHSKMKQSHLIVFVLYNRTRSKFLAYVALSLSQNLHLFGTLAMYVCATTPAVYSKFKSMWCIITQPCGIQQGIRIVFQYRRSASPHSANKGLSKDEPGHGHAVCILWVHSPTSPCPTLSAHIESISQGHCRKWHHQLTPHDGCFSH